MIELPLSILIVDDEQTVQQALEQALEHTGWRIAVADDAEHAIDRTRDRHFDVFVVDKNLPGRDGIELSRQLRERFPDAAILILTGYGTADSAREALNLGVDAYLEKPLEDIYAIEDAIRKAHERRKEHAADHDAPALGTQPRLRVLVAAPNADELAQQLDKRDVAVKLPPDGDEALARLAETMCDAALLGGTTNDVMVLVHDLHDHHPRLPLIIAAERLPLSAVRSLIDLDVRAVIDGPVGSPGFRDKLAGILDRYRTRRLLFRR